LTDGPDHVMAFPGRPAGGAVGLPGMGRAIAATKASAIRLGRVGVYAKGRAMAEDLGTRFMAAYRSLQALEGRGRYLGAFIFGSVARGEATEGSDLDVKVLVDEDTPCPNVNHPVIGGVKLDISFVSLAQLRRDTEAECARAVRVPMLAESRIVFDTTGVLAELRAWARQATPEQATSPDFQWLRFLLYNAHDKVTRALARDAATALLEMHLGLAEVLDIDRRLRGRWEVSSKRLLPLLRAEDPPLAGMVADFVGTAAVAEKFRHWTAIVEHVARPLGNWRVAEQICDCAVCRADLAALFHD